MNDTPSPAATTPFRVLFLCTGNSARSILAEHLLNAHGAPAFEAHSAGSRPTGRINPLAIAVLGEIDLDADDALSKSWDAFVDGPPLDLVVTVCDAAAAEACPVFPGPSARIHWALPDPAALDKADGSTDAERLAAFRYVRDRLERLVAGLVALGPAALRTPEGLAAATALDAAEG